MRLRLAPVAAAGLAVMLLSACGTDPGDRALSGGLLGAGTGAAIGALAGGAGTGALIGGLGGATIGAVTSPRQLDLGTPPWRHHEHYGYAHHRHYATHYVCHHTSPDEKVCHKVSSRYAYR